ncbi:MAG: error-prone DNA polymerase [Planctomycetota bacterium]|jgi:error-prone DNA polymerase
MNWSAVSGFIKISKTKSFGTCTDYLVEPLFLTAYAELHCISNFTFLRGASHPEELVSQARLLDYHAIAITDECSLSGVVRAHIKAKEEKIALIIGSEFRLQDGPHCVLLATDRDSYGRLSHLITLARRHAPKGNYYIDRTLLSSNLPHGCLALWFPCKDKEEVDTEGLKWMANLFPDRCWIAVELLFDGNDRQQLKKLKEVGDDLNIPLCACGDVHMHLRKRRLLQDTLTAIRFGKPLSQLGYTSYANGERHLRKLEQLVKIYPLSLLKETIYIADLCHFSLDELRYEYPSELVPKGHTAQSWLRHLVEYGMRKRWPDIVPEKVRLLVEKELKLVHELKYEQYFLTVHDLVEFARGQKILCQGRGSAANSSICYCLGITEVDPDRMDLLFERFISKERDEPPDIDVDFEHERREEVIQYIYKKYGRERAALTATVITYQTRSAIRDVGKALGMELTQVERLSKAITWWDKDVSSRLQKAGFSLKNPLIERLIFLVTSLLHFPRHLSQHVGGFVISQGTLSHLVPIENASMVDRTVIQWEKNDLESLGLLKVDVLSLGMLTAIRKALQLVSNYRGVPMPMEMIPPEDPVVYQMIQKADTVGVFQIESRAQMSMLPRLKPKNYYDLVIQIAIVRPGPIQGEMVHPYLARRSGKEAINYPGEAVKKVLERTLGVPIFQEQVMQLAIVAAGFSPGEADQLRRCMAAWNRKGGLEAFEDKLLSGMKERGYTKSFAKQIFNQIKGFGEYGFPESHSASFALLAYVSSWLKCYYPAAFTCALLNSQPMGFYAPAQLVQDARRHGVTVLPVDVNQSYYDCSLYFSKNELPEDPQLRLGLRMIKGLSVSAANALVNERELKPYSDIQELVTRTQLSKGDIQSLAEADALKSISGDRHRSYWQVLDTETPLPLFPNVTSDKTEVMLRKPKEGEDILTDYASTGLSLRRHPLALLRQRLNNLGATNSGDLWKLDNKAKAKAAGIVTSRQRPGTASGVMFFTLEDEYGFINTVIWPSLIERYRHFITSVKLLEVNGVVQQQDGVLHLIAEQLLDRSVWLSDMKLRSRDFC